MKEKASSFFKTVQDQISKAVEAADGRASFQEDLWIREETSSSGTTMEGGGGRSRVLSGGAILERAGVNFSEVNGNLAAEMCQKLVGRNEQLPFYATGVSLVFHPLSPMVPTVHANFRYLEVGEKKWFGGGTDLTPYVLFEEDAVHFHQSLKNICDKHELADYQSFKKACDQYFYLPHRGEHRGIGGVFFDYLGRDNDIQPEAVFDFVKEMALGFNDCYLPIVEKRTGLDYGKRERDFQLLRRGRYVEFNLIHDRGTQFGLRTGGRTESILMSLPPLVSWEYNHQPEAGSAESRLLEVLSRPKDWLMS